MIAVSVTMPVYNVEKYLRRSLNTVLEQTFKLPYEIICVDDGSTDGSSVILQEYKEKYPDKFKIIRQENKGLSEARNTALKYVTGKYTMFVDADDFIAKNALEGLYNYAETHNSEVVVFDFLQAREGTNDVRRHGYPEVLKKYGHSSFNAETAEPFVFKELSCATWCKFYLTDFVKNIKFASGLNSQDVCHWAEVFVKAKRINYFSAPYYFYVCGRENAITEIKGKKLYDVFKVFEKTKNILKEAGYFEKYKDVHYVFFSSYVMFYITKIYPELRPEFIDKIKNFEIETDFESILNGDFLRYEKEDVFLLKLIKERDYKTIEDFCYEKRIWKK